MKKETSKKSKLWIWIVAAAILLLAAGGGVLALVLGGQNANDPPATDPLVTGPRADLYWNLDREFYTANSLTGLSTREADANGQFKMRFAFNGEIVELVAVDKKLVNIIDTQDIVGLQFDENGVIIGQINVRELATEVGKKVYVKKITDDMIIANSSMAMNGMELNLKLGQYSEIYDLREGSETYGKKIAPSDLGVMDCMTVYANADGDNTHFFVLSAATRSKIYWRANPWVSVPVNRGGLDPDENGVWTLPFYCEGELVQIKTKDAEIVDYYAQMGKHSGYTGFIFDEEGYAIDILNAAVGVAGQQIFYGMDVVEINGTHVKLKNYLSTTGIMEWEGDIPVEAPIYNVSSWAYSEGVMGQKLSVTDLKVGDRITMFSDMEGNPIELGLTLRRVDMKPMFNNSRKFDEATRTTTRVKGEDGYWEYTFINEKGIHKYKTKDQKLANFIDSYPERVFAIVTKGDKLVKAYEYECLYGYTRFSTALYVDSVNGSIISCTDQKKANAYTAMLSEDYKVLDISGDSKQWGQKIKLQAGDCMISFRNTNKEVCMIYVTRRTMGGKLYVNTTPNTSRAPKQVDKNGNPLEEKDWYWEYEMTDINGKKVTLTLPVGKKDANGTYANKYLQSRIDGAVQGIIALEVSGSKIKDAHTPANMASGNAVNSVIITKAGTEEFEYKTAAMPNDEVPIYPGWTGSEGLKKINLSGDYKSHKGEKLSGNMKVNDVYYMVRNRANETVALFLISRGFHNDLFFLKENYPIVNGVTTRPTDADGYYIFKTMYAGKGANVKTKDVAIATQLDGYRYGAALKLDKKAGNVVLAANDFKGTNDAYASVVGNWDVSKISGKKVTVTLNIPTATTTVGDKREIDITGAKVYNISPDAGENFGKITKLQKNDRVRVYSDKNGNISYVLVTVRGGVKTAECAHCGKTVTWNPITASSGMGNGSAHYYLFADMEVTGQMSVSGADTNEYDVVIDLNGKTLFNVANTGRTFTVAYPGKTLTLMDTVGTAHVKSYGSAGNAGLIQVSYGATLNILGGTYELLPLQDGMTATRQGGVIFSYNDNNYPDHRNTVNIKGGTFIGNEVVHKDRATDPGLASVYSYGGTLYAQKTDVYMTGGTIKNGIADRGGNIYLGNTATFTMTGGEVVGGQAKNRGGNFFAATGSKITIDGGKVLNGTVLENYVEWEEGGVKQSKKTGQQGGNFVGYDITILSGEVSGGSANTNGGNFFLLGNGNKLAVYGGKLGTGTAKTGGGNVYVYGGEGLVEVYGGEIDASGITIATDGSKGSVLVANGGKLGAASIFANCGAVIGGDVKIDKLTLNKDAKDMGIKELTADAKIVVDASDKFAKAYEGFETLDIAAYIGNQIVPFDAETTTITCQTIENVKYLVATVESTEPDPGPGTDPDPEPEIPEFAPIIENANKLVTDGVFTPAEGQEPGIVSAVCPVCGGEAVEWTPLTNEAITLVNGGHYYLAESITDAGRLSTTANSNSISCIHLNGKTYDMGINTNAIGAIRVNVGTTVNIMDASDNAGTVIGPGQEYQGLFGGGAIDARGTVNIYGGTYMTNREDRPAVANFGSAGDGSTVNMYGGKIVRNEAVVTTTDSATSSLVRMHHAKQTFNMYGGEITGGLASQGGNVYMLGGTFNMYGGTIKNGTAGNLGGNVRLAGGTFNMEGGEILNGTATSATATGGSIGLAGSAVLNVSGGTIDGGTAAHGGVIGNNGATVNVSGTAVIKNGVAKNNGGNLTAMSGTMNITGGTISGGQIGTAPDLRANDLFVYEGKTLTLGKATIGKLVTSGTVTVNNGAVATINVNASGSIVLADNLAEGTQVYINDVAGEGAALTAANPKASEYANKYILSGDEQKVVMVNAENQLYLASKQALMEALNTTLSTATTNTEAVCPLCAKNATWVAITGEYLAGLTPTSGNYLLTETHYFLAENIDMPKIGEAGTTSTRLNANAETGAANVCLHLNGKTLDQKSDTNAMGVILISKDTTVSIMGEGTVIGTGLTGSNMFSGAVDVRGTLNIYGGTYKSSRADRPAVAPFSPSALAINMYGGTITAGAGELGNAGASNVWLNAASHVFNMYGGTIENGVGQYGGNLRIKAGTFNMYGGTITGGRVNTNGGNIANMGGTFNYYGGTITGGKIVGEPEVDSNYHGVALVLGKGMDIGYVNATAGVTVNNGAKAVIKLGTNAVLTLADDLAEGTEIIVLADATKTVATHEKAAEYVAANLIKTTIEGATITNPEGTNDIVLTIPTTEPTPEA